MKIEAEGVEAVCWFHLTHAPLEGQPRWDFVYPEHRGAPLLPLLVRFGFEFLIGSAIGSI